MGDDAPDEDGMIFLLEPDRQVDDINTLHGGDEKVHWGFAADDTPLPTWKSASTEMRPGTEHMLKEELGKLFPEYGREKSHAIDPVLPIARMIGIDTDNLEQRHNALWMVACCFFVGVQRIRAMSCAHRRFLGVIECFAGEGEITKACASSRLRVKAFDIDYDDAHDVETDRGFLLWLETLMFLRPGGLLWMAPVCSSWAWINNHTSGRTRFEPWGKDRAKHTVSGNIQCVRCLLLAFLARTVSCHVVIEQPLSSSMMRLGCVTRFRQQAAAHLYTSWLGALGAPTLKPTRLCSNAPWAHHLATDRPDMEVSSSDALVTVESRPGKPRSVTGSAALKSSQAYPRAFGMLIARHVSFALFGIQGKSSAS